MRCPVEAQATWVAGVNSWLPDVPLTCDGWQIVSPSPSVMNALPLLLRDTMFSTVARKP